MIRVMVESGLLLVGEVRGFFYGHSCFKPHMISRQLDIGEIFMKGTMIKTGNCTRFVSKFNIQVVSLRVLLLTLKNSIEQDQIV